MCDNIDNQLNGHLCLVCLQWHDWPPSVFAHWDDGMGHTCECKSRVYIQRGEIINLGEQIR